MEVLIFIAGQIIGVCIGFITCALCVSVGKDRKDGEHYVEPEDNNRDCKDDPER